MASSSFFPTRSDLSSVNDQTYLVLSRDLFFSSVEETLSDDFVEGKMN